MGLRHGAYAPLRLGGRAKEIAAVVALEAPDAPGVTVQVLAMALARAEAAQAACDEVDAAVIAGDGSALGAYLGSGAPPLERLRQDLRGWTHTAFRCFEQLGMTPTSAARIVEATADRRNLVQVNLAAFVQSPDWLELRDRILDALGPHPDALADVMKALSEGEA